METMQKLTRKQQVFVDYSLENPRVFGRNTRERDMINLYFRLVDLGMEYRSGKVYLADRET